MKQVTSRQRSASAAPHRLSVSEAKAKLSEAIRALDEAPMVIHSRGRDVAVLVSVEDYGRLAVARGAKSGASFVRSVENLKNRLGGGAELDVEPARLNPFDPFAPKRKRREK